MDFRALKQKQYRSDLNQLVQSQAKFRSVKNPPKYQPLFVKTEMIRPSKEAIDEVRQRKELTSALDLNKATLRAEIEGTVTAKQAQEEALQNFFNRQVNNKDISDTLGDLASVNGESPTIGQIVSRMVEMKVPKTLVDSFKSIVESHIQSTTASSDASIGVMNDIMLYLTNMASALEDKVVSDEESRVALDNIVDSLTELSGIVAEISLQLQSPPTVAEPTNYFVSEADVEETTETLDSFFQNEITQQDDFMFPIPNGVPPPPPPQTPGLPPPPPPPNFNNVDNENIPKKMYDDLAVGSLGAKMRTRVKNFYNDMLNESTNEGRHDVLQSVLRMNDTTPAAMYRINSMYRVMTVPESANISSSMKLEEEEEMEGSGLKGGKPPLKIGKNGSFGSLKINMNQLKRMKLIAKNSSGKKVAEGVVSPDLLDLLTKRYNNKRTYDKDAVETFKKLVELAKFPVTGSRSKKYQIARGVNLKNVKKNKGKKKNNNVKYVYFDETSDLTKRLNILMGQIKAGNTSKSVKQEATQLMTLLKDEGVLKGKKYEKMINSVLGL